MSAALQCPCGDLTVIDTADFVVADREVRSWRAAHRKCKAGDYPGNPCAEFDWCGGGFGCRGEHFWHGYLDATMPTMYAPRARRTGQDVTKVTVAMSFTPTEEMVPAISITTEQGGDIEMSIYEARVVVEHLTHAIDLAAPFWAARPDVMNDYVQVWGVNDSGRATVEAAGRR